MPIILKIQGSEDQVTSVWEITETEQQLLEKVALRDNEVKVFSAFKSEQRRREWLAVRALLKELRTANPEIYYKENGKPYFKNTNEEISISHSGTCVAIALSSTSIPGVDIEMIHTRINKIGERFISENEKAFINQSTLTEQLCLIWACKEVLYKMYPAGMLTFKTNLQVSPFNLSDSGEITGTIRVDQNTLVYKLSYKRIKNYFLVFSV